MQGQFEISRRQLVVGAGLVGASSLAAMAFAKSSAAPEGQAGRRDGVLDPGKDPIPIAFVMDEGATMIDFAGPWEVFQDVGILDDVTNFDLFTVSGTRDRLQTSGNMTMTGNEMKTWGLTYVPDHAYRDAPQPRVIVMGAQQNHTPEKIAWIRAAAARADVVMSVCTGAFLLAKTGLLDGLQATTHHDFYDQFADSFPKVSLVRSRRFVDNGKFITAGGLTSGIDAALHVVNRFHGQANAQRVADYMEYQSRGWV